MTSPEKEAVGAAEDYKQELSGLTGNNKTQINMLTMLAEDYEKHSSHIVNVLEEEIFKVEAPRKMLMLYVIDSIVKNVPSSGNYRGLFSRNIVKLFEHVFKESKNEKVRASLHKLRLTWTDIFPRAKLFGIDTKIHEIDAAWPIQSLNATKKSAGNSDQSTATVTTSGGTVHLNPKFLAANEGKDKQAATTTTSVTSNGSAKPETPNAKKEQGKDSTTEGQRTVAPKKSAMKKPAAPAKPIKEEQPDEKPIQKTVTPPIKREPEWNESSIESVPMKKKKVEDAAANSKSPPVDPDQKKQPSISSLGPIPRKSATRRQQNEHSQSPDDIRTHKQPKVQNDLVADVHQYQQRRQHHHQHNEHARGRTPPVPTTTGNIQPTVALGSHAFAKVEPVAMPMIHMVPPGQIQAGANIRLSTPGFTALIPPPQQIVSTGYARPPPMTTLGMMTQPLPVLSTSIPTAAFMSPGMVPQMQASPPVIKNDTPKIQGPANNRIFVDGKAYEVLFLEDVGVIERNSLPHRVYFTGPPRDVIIDGQAHRMAFGESKTVHIDGQPHVLRFGAPSRELYMGNFPFKGAFGGPPIIATINGRRHEIRLCGPPPEVKIEQDPCYELTRHMQNLRQSQMSASSFGQPPVTRAPEVKKEDPLDVGSLLNKLKNAGVFNQVREAAAESRSRGENIRAGGQGMNHSGHHHRMTNSPPIPSNTRYENVERRAAPMSSLEQFSMRSLVIRYDSVIEALHRPRVTCPQCGVAFKEIYGGAYQRHLDWHIQDAINAKKNQYSRSRPLYMTDDWATYSETEIANRLPTTAGEEKTSSDEQASGSTQLTGDASTEATDIKECMVCTEKFEEYWDEDDDVWKLKDCIVEDGRVFHRYCKSDVPLLDTSSSLHHQESLEIKP